MFDGLEVDEDAQSVEEEEQEQRVEGLRGRGQEQVEQRKGAHHRVKEHVPGQVGDLAADMPDALGSVGQPDVDVG